MPYYIGPALSPLGRSLSLPCGPCPALMGRKRGIFALCRPCLAAPKCLFLYGKSNFFEKLQKRACNLCQGSAYWLCQQGTGPCKGLRPPRAGRKGRQKKIAKKGLPKKARQAKTALTGHANGAGPRAASQGLQKKKMEKLHKKACIKMQSRLKQL